MCVCGGGGTLKNRDRTSSLVVGEGDVEDPELLGAWATLWGVRTAAVSVGVVVRGAAVDEVVGGGVRPKRPGGRLEHLRVVAAPAEAWEPSF